MSSTVNADCPEQKFSPLSEPPTSAAEQLAVLDTDLRMLHERLQTVTRPDLNDEPTPSPIEAMKMYAGSGNALRLNRYLRGELSGQSEALRKMNAGMLAFFEEHSRVLHAALTMRRWVFTHSCYAPALLTPRTIVTEPGWSSLTLNSFHAFLSPRADVEYEVTLPIGSRILSGFLPEREFILRPGSVFRVKDLVVTDEEVGTKRRVVVGLDLL